MRSELEALATERFVSLTTFRKSGDRVSTPVWIARDGDNLLVTTPAEAGKVKRLRNSSRIELQPCGRFGKVSGRITEANATIEEQTEAFTAIFRKKYSLEYQLFTTFERGGERLILRIS